MIDGMDIASPYRDFTYQDFRVQILVEGRSHVDGIFLNKDGEKAGFFRRGIEGKKAYHRSLEVLPPYRGQGLAKHFSKETEKIYKETGIEEIIIPFTHGSGAAFWGMRDYLPMRGGEVLQGERLQEMMRTTVLLGSRRFYPAGRRADLFADFPCENKDEWLLRLGLSPDFRRQEIKGEPFESFKEMIAFSRVAPWLLQDAPIKLKKTL